MVTNTKAKIWTLLIAILGFIFSANTVFADYQAFANNWPSTAVGGYSGLQVFGLGTGNQFDVLYVATSSVRLLDRIGANICQLGGSDGGAIYLEVRTTSTSSYVFASSTVLVNSSNIYRGADCNVNTTATTTIFELNNTVSYSPTTNLWLSFRVVGITGTIFASFQETVSSSDNFYTFTAPSYSQLYLAAPYSKAYSMMVSGYANGLIPPNQGQNTEIYGSTTSAVVCTTFEIDCYLIKALKWAFYPSNTFDIIDTMPSIGSTTPFAYLFEGATLYESLWNGTATGTQSITLTFAPMGLATSTLSAGSLATVATQTGMAPLMANLRSWISVFMYLLLTWGVTKFVLKILGVQFTLSTETRMINYGKAKGIL